jgi:Lrp/AsnC family transcriptional regulator, leucine-responsive regulatory protein
MKELDEIDIQILQLLQHDAHLTIKELADKLGKTATPIFERKKRLEEEGYIQKYVAVIDRHKINKSLVAYTNVQLKEHSHPMLKSFEKLIVKFDEVMECQHMTGLYDYLLKVVVANMDEYQEFIVGKLSKLPNIGTVQSSFVMTELKNERSYTIKKEGAANKRF